MSLLTKKPPVSGYAMLGAQAKSAAMQAVPAAFNATTTAANQAVPLARSAGTSVRQGADGPAALLDQLDAHQRVVVKEGSRRRHVGADAANDRGEVHDDIRARFGEGRADRIAFAQVTLRRTRGEHGRDVAVGELFKHLRTEEPRSAGDENALAGQQIHLRMVSTARPPSRGSRRRAGSA